MLLKHIRATRFVILLIATLYAGLSIGCFDKGSSQPAVGNVEDARSYQVVAVSYPLQYLTQRIAGDAINVRLPMPSESTDPQNWRPSRESVSQMQAADLIIANGTGATYAKWLTTVSLPDSRIRNAASRGLSLSDYIAVEDVTVVHSHGPEGEHSHPTMVARTWLDPAIAKKQAIYIAGELAQIYPDLSGEFSKNLKSISDQLDQLSQQLDSIKLNDSIAIVTATPKLKFLSRAVGLGDQHLIWFETPEVERAKSDLKALSKPAGRKPVVLLFDDELPSDEIGVILKANGITPIAIDLIDRKPDAGDFLSVMQMNIKALASAAK